MAECRIFFKVSAAAYRGQQEVILTGEAYFKVEHNAKMPFRLQGSEI
ncbi:hypothetical protein [Chitinophaga sp. RAB17]